MLFLLHLPGQKHASYLFSLLLMLSRFLLPGLGSFPPSSMLLLGVEMMYILFFSHRRQISFLLSRILAHTGPKIF